MYRKKLLVKKIFSTVLFLHILYNISIAYMSDMKGKSIKGGMEFKAKFNNNNIFSARA